MLLVFHHALSGMGAASSHTPIDSLLLETLNQDFCKLLKKDGTTYEQVEQCINTTRPNINCYSNDDKQMTPLHILMSKATKITRECVKLLCLLHADRNAPILAPKKMGWTPLHCAVRSRQDLGVFEDFINMGANPNQQNAIGDTPLHLLLKKAKPEDFEDLDEEDEEDQNPIQNPVESADFAIYKLLSGCTKLSIQNQAGDTPLHLATAAHYNDQKDWLKVCVPLMTQAAINLPNEKGLTPLASWCKSFAASDSFAALNNADNSLETINQRCSYAQVILVFKSKGAVEDTIDKQGQLPIEYLLQTPKSISRFSEILSALVVPYNIYEPIVINDAGEKATLHDQAVCFGPNRFGVNKIVALRHKQNTTRLIKLFPVYRQFKTEYGHEVASALIKAIDNEIHGKKKTEWDSIVEKHQSFEKVKQLFTQKLSENINKKRTLAIEDQPLSQEKRQKLPHPEQL